MRTLHHKMSTNFGKAISASSAIVIMVVDDIAHDPEQPHRIVYKLENGTAYDLGAFGFSGVGAEYSESDESIILLGHWGEIIILRPNQDPISAQLPANRGPMRYIKKVGSRFYCVGTNLQAFESIDGIEWTDISPTDTLRARYPRQHLERCHGFGETELYAAGSGGMIWRYDGQQWNPIQCQTNARLLDVDCASDGNVYFSGEFGTVIRGRNETFEILNSNPDVTNFWGICHFEGKIFVAGISALMLSEGEKMVPDVAAMEIAQSFYDLSTTSTKELWSFGAKDTLFRVNGAWKRLNEVQVSC